MTTMTDTDRNLATLRSLELDERATRIRLYALDELQALHFELLGPAKPKTPRPTLERKILAALAAPVRVAEAPELELALEPAAPDEDTIGAAIAITSAAAQAVSESEDDAAGEREGEQDDESEGTGEGESDGDEERDRATPAPAAPRGGELPAVGTIIVKRDRHGAERARCEIVAGGVLYNGITYKSLSGAALAAHHDLGGTTKQLDGWTWWGVKARPKKPARPRAGAPAVLAAAWDRYAQRAAELVACASEEERAALLEAIATQTAALGDLAAKLAPAGA